MKKIMFAFVFVMLLFTTSFGYTLTIKNGDYTLVREGVMANTTMEFGTTFALGWNVISGGITPERVNAHKASFTMPANNVEIEVKEFKYTIVYNGNGATSGSTASSTHYYGTSQALTANGFSKTGYTFAGWGTKASGAVTYSNSQQVLNLCDTIEGTVTLYAKWKASLSSVFSDFYQSWTSSAEDTAYFRYYPSKTSSSYYSVNPSTFTLWGLIRNYNNEEFYFYSINSVAYSSSRPDKTTFQNFSADFAPPKATGSYLSTYTNPGGGYLGTYSSTPKIYYWIWDSGVLRTTLRINGFSNDYYGEASGYIYPCIYFSGSTQFILNAGTKSDPHIIIQ